MTLVLPRFNIAAKHDCLSVWVSMDTILHHPEDPNIEYGGTGGRPGGHRPSAVAPAGGAGLCPSTVSELGSRREVSGSAEFLGVIWRASDDAEFPPIEHAPDRTLWGTRSPRAYSGMYKTHSGRTVDVQWIV